MAKQLITTNNNCSLVGFILNLWTLCSNHNRQQPCIIDKKMKLSYTMIIIVTTLICSCQSGVKNNSDLQLVRVTEYDSIYVHSNVPIGDISEVAMYQNTMILKQNAHKDVFLCVDCPTGNVVATWGTYGHGPKEFTGFGMNVEVRDSTLVFMEWDSRTLHALNVNDMIANKKQFHVSSQTYPYTRDFRPNKLYRLGNGWLALGCFANSRLGYLTADMKEVALDIDYPFEHRDISCLYAGTVFQSKAACAESRGAIITNMSDALEIVSVDSMGNITKTAEVKPTMLPKYSDSFGRLVCLYKENSVGYIDLCVDSEYVYVLSGGALNYSECVEKGLTASSVVKYDWEGHPVCEYELPFYVCEICVQGTKMYGIRMDGEDVIIYSFELEQQ